MQDIFNLADSECNTSLSIGWFSAKSWNIWRCFVLSSRKIRGQPKGRQICLTMPRISPAVSLLGVERARHSKHRSTCSCSLQRKTGGRFVNAILCRLRIGVTGDSIHGLDDFISLFIRHQNREPEAGPTRFIDLVPFGYRLSETLWLALINSEKFVAVRPGARTTTTRLKVLSDKLDVPLVGT